MFEELKGVPRLLMHVELKPIQGDRFQPTGFADLGAAVYERPDGKRMLLVESAQSMANRLEQTCINGQGSDLVPELNGLPYVVANLTGTDELKLQARTSSLVEPHRLNSPFILEGKLSGDSKRFGERLLEQIAYSNGSPIDWQKVASALFLYDPNSLLHGIFLAHPRLEAGRVRTPRALSAFIEAEDVREVSSGGVKNSALDPTGKIRVVGDEKNDVYGNVPYHRTEYTGNKITAYFNFDLALLRGYSLPEAALEVLVALALYKVSRFLGIGLRLRTACDLRVSGEIQVEEPKGFSFPAEPELLKAVQQGIAKCSKAGLFARPAVTELTATVKRVKSKKLGNGGSDDQESDKSDDDRE
jgi:CRISPR-associated protein Csb1